MSWGSKLPSRPRGALISTGPRSVCSVLRPAPLRTLALCGTPPGGWPRCSVSSAPNAVSITRPANWVSSPPGPVISSASRPSNASWSASSGSKPASRSTTSWGGCCSGGSALRSGRRMDCMVLIVMSGPLSGRPPGHPSRSPLRGSRDVHRQRFAGELVDDVEQLERAAVDDLVELEVDRPHMTGPLGAQPVGRHRGLAQPLALAPPGWDPQAFLAPDPLHPLAVDHPPVFAQP